MSLYIPWELRSGTVIDVIRLDSIVSVGKLRNVERDTYTFRILLAGGHETEVRTSDGYDTAQDERERLIQLLRDA